MGEIIGFIIWTILGIVFIALGIFCFASQKAVGFWANIKMYEVNNVKGYNHAVGKLWISYGVILIILGLPLLSGQNSPFILLSVVGVMIETIILMVIYTLFITPKYCKK